MSAALVHDKRKALAAARRQLLAERRLAFDGLNLNSRPTPVQLDMFQDTTTRVFWVVASNRSGKTSSGARVVSWWFNDDHPYQERPAEWAGRPLQILVVGRVGEQIASELYERKIKPLLQPGTYKEVRIGNELRRLEHRTNGNRVIFMSHHDAANAREKVQAFTADVVWLDEMPDDVGLVTELLMRVSTTNGRLYATFTPLIRNEEIRRLVETQTSYSRKIQLRILDNPLFKGREAEIEAEIRAMCSSEDEFRARMYGDWYQGDTRVFAYMSHHRGMPEHYSPSWRHIAVCDPAASGYAGLVIGAEDPVTGTWVVTKAIYLQGAAAIDLLASVERELHGVNIVAKWTDCNPAGFHKESARQGMRWRPYTEKAGRKLDTIDKLNVWLKHRRIQVAPAAYRLEDEFTICSWADRSSNKIVHESKFHLLDCVRYLVDVAPPWDPALASAPTGDAALRSEWHKVREERAAARTLQIQQLKGRWGMRSTPGRWAMIVGNTH